MSDALEGVGIDPVHTPADALPEHGQWALAYHFHSLENDE